jgi:hypothetical protein
VTTLRLVTARELADRLGLKPGRCSISERPGSCPMLRTAPRHAPDERYHHSNSECVYAAPTPNGPRHRGDGGKPLCLLCERLNRAEDDLERN